MDPVTMSLLFFGSSALQAYGSIGQGLSQASALRASEKVGQFNADTIIRESNEAEAKQRMQARRSLGRQRAAVSANGLAMTGSALDWLEESSAQAELDALNIRYEGRSRAINQQFQAGMAGQQAKDVTQAGYIGAGAAALNGVSSYLNYTS